MGYEIGLFYKEWFFYLDPQTMLYIQNGWTIPLNREQAQNKELEDEIIQLRWTLYNILQVLYKQVIE